ncbi:MAG: hypothetical protein HWE20_15010, partial [Gammaproteobacteria bacterium]|nr:hypothetical protein [Gammaproteobacteria bacterium]
DQTKFDAARTEETVTYTTTNPLTGATGTTYTTYYKIGSSSDRVDNALNSVLPVNKDPVANDDTSDVSISAGFAGGPALEEGADDNTNSLNTQTINGNLVDTVNAQGNVISNGAGGDTADSDEDGDTIVLTDIISSSTNISASVDASTPGVITGAYGTLTINSDGSYSYLIDNTNSDVDALRTSSDTLSDAFTYTISDGNGGTDTAILTIKIVGSNDAPLAYDDYNVAKESLTSELPNNSVNYDANDPLGVLATGNVLTNDTDVDSGDGKSILGLATEGSATGTYSGSTSSLTFTNPPNNVKEGYYVYYGNSALKDSSGNILQIATGYVAGTSNISLTGGFDATTSGISGISSLSDLNGKTITFALKSNGTGSSGDAVLTSSTSTGVVNVTNVTGNLAVGMVVSGNNIATGTTIQGINYDSSGNPVSITLSVVANITNEALTFTGSGSAGTTMIGQYGNLLLNADGSYTYTPFADSAALVEGETGQEAFTYTMVDTAGAKSQATLFITVYGSGVNDPIASDHADTASEEGTDENYTSQVLTAGTTASGSVSWTSPVGSASVTAVSIAVDGVLTVTSPSSGTITISGKYGELVMNATTGAYTYTVTDSAAVADALAKNETVVETFNYRVENASGADFADLVITVTGANDAPIAVDDALSGSVNGPALTGQVLSNDTDVDNGDTKTLTEIVFGDADNSTNHALSSLPSATAVNSTATVAGTYGTLTINSDGIYSYAINASNASLAALPLGQSVDETFTYRMVDSQGQWSDATLTFTINGENERPVNDYPNSVTVTGNSYIFSGSDLLSVSDVDGNLSSVTLHVDHGTLDVDTTLPGSVSGDASSDIVISGTQAEINAILATLVYTPTNGYVGNDYLTIFSQDSNNA